MVLTGFEECRAAEAAEDLLGVELVIILIPWHTYSVSPWHQHPLHY